MLKSLVNFRKVVFDVYMDDIADIICHIYQYFIQQKHDIHFWHLC